MALAGRDLAILSARFGVARFGASRFGFCPDDVEGAGTSEPGEYIWKEDPPPTTLWTLATDNCYCGTPPVASFTLTPDSGVLPLDVTFTDTSTGGIVFWYWDFGDGTTSTLQNPTHSYGSAGTYTVSLWVSGPGGVCTTPATDIVTVTAPTTTTVSGIIYYTDGGSVPWAAITVELQDLLAVVIDTTTTNGSGQYSFSGVAAGDIVVVVPPQAAPGGLTPQYGNTPGTAVAGVPLALNVICNGAMP